MDFEELDDTDAEALQLVATKANLDALKAGTADPRLALAAKRVDRLIADSPGLDGDKILYRGITGDGSKLRDGVGLKDAGYTVLTATKPKADTVLAVKLLKGTKALEVDGHYLLPRGLTLELKPTAEGDIPAVLASQIGGLTASASTSSDVGIIFNQPQGDAIAEFYNHAHGRGGRFAPAGGSSSGGGGTKSSGGKAAGKTVPKKKGHPVAKQIAKNVATGLAYLAIITTGTLLITASHLGGTILKAEGSGGLSKAQIASRKRINKGAANRPAGFQRAEESAHDWYERTLREKPVIR